MSKYFYHGIKNGLRALDTVLDIFNSGGIKSKRLQKRSYRIGFNGPDYISVCKKGAKEEYESGNNNAFEVYVLNSFCFIIKDDIEAVQGEFIPNLAQWDRFELVRFMNVHPERRITDMFDEWQVRDEISFISIIGLGIPFDWVDTMMEVGSERVKELIKQIISLAGDLGLDIIDSSNPDFVEKYEAERLDATTRKRL